LPSQISINPARETRRTAAASDQEVVHLWQAFPFEVTPDYAFFPDDPVFKAAHLAMDYLVYAVFAPIDALAFGLKIQGRENLAVLRETGAVTVANHVHILDCIFSASALRKPMPAFLSQASNFRVPIIRRLVRILGALPLPEDAAGLRALNAAVADHLRGGGVVHVYPEGVLIPYSRGIRPFRRGAFAFAADAGVPVLPMVITYRRPAGAYRLYKKKPLLTLTILPPLWPDPALAKGPASRELLSRTRQAMAAAFQAENDPSA
jgi:1-acyl-sn-glycerol-3-phosphate acyltransferase